MPRGLAFLALSACLSSCAILPTSHHSEQEEFMPMAQPIGPARRVVQQLTAIWPGKQETLLCVLELDQQHIAIAGLSSDGISLFNLSYDGKKLVLDKSPLLPDSFSPELIIKDLQLAYWPVSELQRLLPQQWRLEADSRHRRLYFNNVLRVDVNYLQPDAIWPKTVELTNHRYHYQLHINTVSYESVPE
ncbi:conserved exported hypothetical protein [Crenothrix polyspora]|uniref:DUF3261 domain-containing protein n=1 Tax=Crenothrix polyspora TaxID=360316 RepID=A0A1R4H106_9GAMM|nr:DUF3261 domain-containing protein [Crenothrix polyspora]SJM89933.1 conserved exported hypothetical protein [Crenothrix polyspora]